MDIVSSKIISKNLKLERKKNKLSQDQLARKAGIPYSTYLNIESGSTPNPTIQNLLNISEALNISIDKLVGKKK